MPTKEQERIKALELEIKQLEAYRTMTRKVFYDAMDASAKSWFREYKRRRKIEREKDSLLFRLNALLSKPKPIRR